MFLILEVYTDLEWLHLRVGQFHHSQNVGCNIECRQSSMRQVHILRSSGAAEDDLDEFMDVTAQDCEKCAHLSWRLQDDWLKAFSLPWPSRGESAKMPSQWSWECFTIRFDWTSFCPCWTGVQLCSLTIPPLRRFPHPSHTRVSEWSTTACSGSLLRCWPGGDGINDLGNIF